MSRRIVTATLLATLVLTGLLTTGASAADPTLPFPAAMAAVGDSITQAASTAGSLGADAPQNSWSTGTSSTVDSHYLRLLALGAQISETTDNLSVSGARMVDLNAQMQNVAALSPQADYLTVLIGGNDVCTDTVAQMTSVADFRAQLDTALATLETGSPGTNVYVVSIPDVYQLWALFKSDFWARFIWSVGGVCQSLLANPTSTQQVDVERRQQVRQRNIDFNTQLAEACAAYARCHFDGDAVFNTQFTKSDVSGDYFHPSVAGQAKLAAVTWTAGYVWSATPPPPDRPMWVGDLTGASTSAGRTWRATVTVTVLGQGDQFDVPVAGVVVTGAWSPGSGGTCTTGDTGSCTIASASLNKKTSSVQFMVSDLAAEGWVYAPDQNDADTVVTIAKP